MRFIMSLLRIILVRIQTGWSEYFSCFFHVYSRLLKCASASRTKNYSN